jgi:hypothetical protein
MITEEEADAKNIYQSALSSSCSPRALRFARSGAINL